ncbi:hypothetical protein QWA68_016500, partial [Fusarium oxysporum]
VRVGKLLTPMSALAPQASSAKRTKVPKRSPPNKKL